MGSAFRSMVQFCIFEAPPAVFPLVTREEPQRASDLLIPHP